ncbi:hypothetical protein, partial [Halomonas sp.]|uniref:hypothetical protein n=1 Tax=Halomonas sp. TaxID=1486246 RepID=UPI00235503C1
AGLIDRAVHDTARPGEACPGSVAFQGRQVMMGWPWHCHADAGEPHQTPDVGHLALGKWWVMVMTATVDMNDCQHEVL